ncbi:6748_t:CDS:2 [Funneliformis geosporum]|uniref:6748_t:CDS:1 n=1 Tax=Funneliformis geosporum TaxID=1117311 RepID=A0A9W4T1M9_9GLOM|nr:6748_t:CDS:2 [Funneliformis geosporum]
MTFPVLTTSTVENTPKYSDRAFPLLPNEVSLIIFSFLTQEVRLNLRQVSKAFRSLIYAPCFWQEVVIYNIKGLELDKTLEILKGVQALDARALKVNDVFVKKLLASSARNTLKVLDLSVTKITDESLSLIGKNCTSLVQLFLEGCRKISNISPLTSICNLTTLILSHCILINDNSIESLFLYPNPHLQTLTKLSIDGCDKVTDLGILLIATKLTKLKYLDIDGQGTSDISITQIFRNCKELELLAVSFCEYLTDKVLIEIIEYLQPNFKFLKLRKGDLFTEAGFSHFFHALSDRGHSFHSLDLSECANITNQSLSHLFQPQLKLINLNWCWKVTDPSLFHIISGCPNLQEIMLTGCNQITCESLLTMDGFFRNDLSSLNILDFWSCRSIEPNIITRFGLSYPKLYIIDYYGEVYKDCKRIGFRDEVFVENEINEFQIGGREKRY